MWCKDIEYRLLIGRSTVRTGRANRGTTGGVNRGTGGVNRGTGRVNRGTGGVNRGPGGGRRVASWTGARNRPGESCKRVGCIQNWDEDGY